MAKSFQLNLPPTPLNRVGETTPTNPKTVGDWQALVPRAFGRSGLTHKLAAGHLEVKQTALSKQLAGLEHLSFWRMFALPREFWQELVLLVIDFYDLQIGLTEQDRRDLELGRSVREAVERRLA